MCQTLLEIYADHFNRLEKNMKKQVGNRSRPENLVLKTYGYEQWFNKESDCEKEIVGTPSMPPQEGN